MLLTPISGLTPEISPVIETILIHQQEVNEYSSYRLVISCRNIINTKFELVHIL